MHLPEIAAKNPGENDYRKVIFGTPKLRNYIKYCPVSWNNTVVGLFSIIDPINTLGGSIPRHRLHTWNWISILPEFSQEQKDIMIFLPNKTISLTRSRPHRMQRARAQMAEAWTVGVGGATLKNFTFRSTQRIFLIFFINQSRFSRRIRI